MMLYFTLLSNCTIHTEVYNTNFTSWVFHCEVWQSSETAQSLGGRAVGDGVEPLPSGMHGMSAGRPAPTGSSTVKIFSAESVPGESWSLGELRPWIVHSELCDQRSANACSSPVKRQRSENTCTMYYCTFCMQHHTYMYISTCKYVCVPTWLLGRILGSWRVVVT